MAFQNRQGYGEIFTIPTGGIDGIAKMVYQEQKQREQQKLQQDKALDDEFAKNVAGVKSSDIPEITKAYSDFKNAHINLQKKGQKATPQDQMDVMIKKANAFQAINASKEDKARLAGYATMTNKPDTQHLYDPNASQYINEQLNTPTSKRVIENDDGKIKYQYAATNIDKEIKDAVTPPKGFETKKIELGIDPNDPLKDKSTTYAVINQPNMVYDKLFSSMHNRSDNDNWARGVLQSLNDDEKNQLRTDYEAKIASPEFKQVYGDVKPFNESAGNTRLGQATALKVMQAFVDLPLKGVNKSVLNADRNKARGVSDKIDAEKRANAEYDRRAEANLKRSLIKINANKPPVVEGVSGNAFDEFGGVKPIYLNHSSGKIDKGVVFDKDGNLYSGEFTADKVDVPANIVTAFTASKIPLPKYSTVVVKDGIIQAIRTPNGEVSRQAMENLQKKSNTEPTKAPQPVFGKPQGNTQKSKSPTPAAKPKKDPLGLF